jgi:hypothetical protein
MSTTAQTAQAVFTLEDGPGKGGQIKVQFNPASLQYTLSNTFKAQSKNQTVTQDVSQATGKLTLDLIFDNTHDGQNVRQATAALMALMKSPDDIKPKQKAPIATIVAFEWGGYKFRGLIESYKETIDFFSADGVPLRSTVNLTLAEQTRVFTATDPASTNADLNPDAVNVPSRTSTSAASLAAQAGNPNAARALGSLNDQASLRFGGDGALTVTGSVTLGPPAAFATASAGVGAGVGVGAGISAGVTGGLGASVTAGVGLRTQGAFAGAPVVSGARFGGSASARVTASQGAFAGLRAPNRPNNYVLETDRLIPVSRSQTVFTEDANFHVGGQAATTSSPGLSADVGATADLRARIQFEVG